MKAISIHVPEQALRRFKSLSQQTGRPMAELIREAMDRYLEERSGRVSVLDLPGYDSKIHDGSFSRSQVWDESSALRKTNAS